MHSCSRYCGVHEHSAGMSQPTEAHPRSPAVTQSEPATEASWERDVARGEKRKETIRDERCTAAEAALRVSRAKAMMRGSFVCLEGRCSVALRGLSFFRRWSRCSRCERRTGWHSPSALFRSFRPAAFAVRFSRAGVRSCWQRSASAFLLDLVYRRNRCALPFLPPPIGCGCNTSKSANPDGLRRVPFTIEDVKHAARDALHGTPLRDGVGQSFGVHRSPPGSINQAGNYHGENGRDQEDYWVKSLINNISCKPA